MRQRQRPLRTLFVFALLTWLSTGLYSQSPNRQITPDLVFQYTSWGIIRLEIRDSIEGMDELTCTYTAQGEQPKPVTLTESENKRLMSLLRSLKKESYSLSLPFRGVVIVCDGEGIEIEINAVSLGLHYRDEYDTAKSHRPIRLLVQWAKKRFPTISTPK